MEIGLVAMVVLLTCNVISIWATDRNFKKDCARIEARLKALTNSYCTTMAAMPHPYRETGAYRAKRHVDPASIIPPKSGTGVKGPYRDGYARARTEHLQAVRFCYSCEPPPDWDTCAKCGNKMLPEPTIRPAIVNKD